MIRRSITIAALLATATLLVGCVRVFSTGPGGDAGAAPGDARSPDLVGPADGAADARRDLALDLGPDAGSDTIPDLPQALQVYTLAGTGAPGFKDGPLLSAQFGNPHDLVVDGQGNLLATDNTRLRLISPTTGQVTTLAGTGSPGDADGPLATARFTNLYGLAAAPAGLYGLESAGRVRLIAGGQVTTVAGTGAAGYKDGPALTAQFDLPHCVAARADGALVVADYDGNRIRLISGGVVSTLAGTGSAGGQDGPAAAATFSKPHSLAFDGQGRLFVAELDERIRMIDKGVVTTVAGTGVSGLKDGPAAAAQFNNPYDIAFDAQGRLFIVEESNHTVRVLHAGQVSTVAGTGKAGYKDGPALSAQFRTPAALAVAGKRIYVIERDAPRVRYIE